jgi:hypothetical protein
MVTGDDHLLRAASRIEVSAMPARIVGRPGLGEFPVRRDRRARPPAGVLGERETSKPSAEYRMEKFV